MSTNTLGQALTSGIDVLDLSDLTVDFSSLNSASMNSTISINGTGAGPVWTTSSVAHDTITLADGHRTNTIQVNGEGADIVINGESLMETLKGLQERLNMLRPNPELEAEWDELRELGQRYRELEQQLQEKTKMWDTLKSMPPPKST